MAKSPASNLANTTDNSGFTSTQDITSIHRVIGCLAEGALLINREGSLLCINSTAKDIFGYSDKEIPDSNIRKLIPELPRLIDQIANQGTAVEIMGKCSHGNTVTLEITARQAGNPMDSFFIVTVRDITQEKLDLEELQRSEARLSFLFNESPVVTYNCEAFGDFACTFISNNVKELFGFEPDSFLNDPGFWSNGIHPEDKVHVFKNLEQLFIHGSHTHCYRFRKLDGVYVWVEDGLKLVYGPDGNPKEIIGYWLNIDERKKIETALIDSKLAAEKANRAKSAFLANMSHELRTPLNAIIGYTELLLEETNSPLSIDQASDLNKIQHASKHLLAQISEILDLGQLEAGQSHGEPNLINFRSILDDAINLITPLAKSRNITLKLHHIPSASFLVYGTELILKKVILNLLSNAVKYNIVGGSVMVETHNTANGGLCITVTDTGRGLSEEQMIEIFQPFTRVGSNEGIEGTGIGLTITKQLVELLGGFISVESKPGSGSSFSISLPKV